MVEQPGQPAAKPDRHRTINERAYAIWHEDGQPNRTEHEVS